MGIGVAMGIVGSMGIGDAEPMGIGDADGGSDRTIADAVSTVPSWKVRVMSTLAPAGKGAARSMSIR